MNEFFKLFRKIEITTSWVKLRDFQYRLLLGKIFANDVLYKWKIKNSAECDWCDTDVQSTSHMLLECAQVQKIWDFVKTLTTEQNVKWSRETILSNTVHQEPKKAINAVVLVTKFFIFQQKCLGNRPTIAVIKNQIYELSKIEEYNATLEGKIAKHVKNWSLIDVTKLTF